MVLLNGKEVDFSSYFQPPSLKDARRRRHETVHIINDFTIPESIRSIGRGKQYLIETYGCQMNEHDTEVMAGILEKMGYQETQTPEDAAVLLINTCAIRENAENKVFGHIGKYKALKREHPDMVLGVCGCMAQEESVVTKILEKYAWVDLIFGTHNIHRLPQLLQEAFFGKEMVVEVWSKEGDIVENLPQARHGHFQAWVNIMYGCDKFCTYCIVPYTRGKERSRRPEEIIAEVRELARQGYQEVTLLGQNVNAYGKDLDNLGTYGLGHLMDDMRQIGIPRIRFTTSHPKDFDDHLIAVLGMGGNLCDIILLPVQSGKSEIMKIMGRGYTRERYLDLFDKLKKTVPNASFTTDIIVGFPNETDAQFEDTLSLVRECRFDGAFTFIYSPRAGTPAARMTDNVPMDVKRERLQRLNTLIDQLSAESNARYQDQVVEVLVEGVSRKNAHVLSGHTRTNKVVNFTGPESLIGQLVSVRITEAKQWSLDGQWQHEPEVAGR
ncbi:MAG: tRNA (N6-isopentenyl adenosine(37)-C2)-methylthiotransferase MiaB [Sporolactobacillus sp.]